MNKRILACVLALTMGFGVKMPVAEAATTNEAAMTQIPGTVKIEKDYDETFLSVTGFAEDMVQDRSHYYEEYVKNGYKDTENYVVVVDDYYADSDDNRITVAEYEALDETAKANYTLVTSEEQFCKGMTHARVVEIRVDLELGFKYLEKNNINTYGVVEAVSNYEKGYEPISSPVLIEVGVSDINVKSHMTIFSPNGSKIEHACFKLNKVEDIVIRNIAIEGNYEWDDVPPGINSTPGNSTRYGWSNVSCNNSKGVWLDHCTFGYTFDGNIDLKNDSQVSITWCQFGVQDTSKDSDLYKNIEYMEEKYQAGEGFIIYTILRDNGATMEQIFNLACEHHSVHLVGSGEDDYETNPLNAITMAYTQYIDCDNRMPKIRQGNGHLFNCYFDAQSYLENCFADETFLKAREAVSEAGYSIKGICRGMDPCLGASIGADTCVWDGFLHPTIGDEINEEGSSGRFVGAINYQLIVNSSLRNWDSEDVYVGSSWDNEGNNPLAGLFTKALSDSYITRKHFQWSEWKPMTKVASEAVDGVSYVPESLIDNLAPGEFYKNYYLGREELGYDYQTFALERVKEVTDLYSGAGKVSFDTDGDWTKLYYGLEENQCVVTLEEEQGEFEEAKTYVYEKNTALGELPVPERIGYNFAGWYEGKYEDVNGEIKLVLSENPVDADTIIAEDMYLYGQWEINKYTLNYDAMNGSEVITFENVLHGASVESLGGLPENPVRDGFTFQGWYHYTPEEGYGAKIYNSTKITADTTFYAKWRPTKVDVIFNSNGGSEVATMEDCGYNTTITLPTPEREGFNFEGWYVDAEFKKEFTATSKLVESLSADINTLGSITLYAKWSEIPAPQEVILSFDVNGGMTEEAISVTPGAAIVELPVPEKAEYVFAGWYRDAEYTTEFTTASAIEVDTTIYAKWVMKGDVNSDGNVDANDALKILKYVAKMDVVMDDLQMQQADVDGEDANVDANDALKILKYVAKMIDGFDF